MARTPRGIVRVPGGKRPRERRGAADLPRVRATEEEERMHGFWDTLGTVTLAMLVAVGLLAGWIAGAIAGRRRALYLVLGVVGAVAAPAILAALGLGVLAAGGLLVMVAAAVVGALVLLVIAKLLFD
jgi:uncharacterized membrane protein YeaQ/YmgE (transglycosylase-associated protein family)